MATYSYKGYDFDVDHEPTAQEFQQMSAYVDTLPPKETPGALKQFGTNTLGTAAALGDIASGVVKAPLAIGAAIGGKLRGGKDYNLEELRAAGQAEVENLMPSFGTTYGLEQTPGYKTTMAPFEALGHGIDWLKGKAGEATGSKEVAGAVGLGADILGLGMGIPGAKVVGKGLARTAEFVDPALRNITPESVRAKLDADLSKQSSVDTAASLLLSDKPVAPPKATATEPALTPMQSMAKSLGADIFANAEEFTPNAISRMAEQLPEFEQQGRYRSVQERVDARNAARTAEDAQRAALDINAERYRAREEASTGYKEHLEQQDAEALRQRQQHDSELAQRAGSGEQAGLWEPHTNMHRAYEEMFAQDEKGTRPFSPTEFTEILQNLSKEEGTAFQMPENIREAYQDYLNHAKQGQGDLFGAHEVLQSTSHKTWGELTPQEKGRATRALNKIGPITESMQERMKALAEDKETGISYLRSGFTKEDILQAIDELYQSSALKGISDRSERAQKEISYSGIPLLETIGRRGRLYQKGHSMIRSPEEALELSMKSGDMKQTNILETGVKTVTGGYVDATGKINTNLLTKGGMFFKRKINHPALHYAVDTILDAHSRANALFTKVGHEMYLPALRSLSDKQMINVWKLLEAADRGKKEITSEIMDVANLTQKERDLVAIHQAGMETAFKKTNEARAALGLSPIEQRPGYTAFNMSGDFRTVIRKPARNADGSINLNAEGLPNLEVVGVLGHDFKKSFEQIKQDLMARDSELQFDDMPPKTGGFAKGSPNAAFQQAMQQLGKDNPGTAELLSLLKELAQQDPATYMGMDKHSMAKKGVFGMDGRQPWKTDFENAKAGFENQLSYLESVMHWAELTDATAKINKVIRDPEMAVKQPKVVEAIEEYTYNALGLDTSTLGRALDSAFGKTAASLGIGPSVPKTVAEKAKMATNALLLSFLNIPNMLINLVQPVVGLPGQTAQLRALGAAPGHTALTQGYDYMARGLFTVLKEMSGKGELNALEQGAIKYAKTHEVYSTEMVERQKHVRKDAWYYTDRIARDPSAVIEMNSRRALYHSLVHMMDSQGITPEQGLYQQAARFTESVMGHTGTLERSPLYNKIGPFGILAVNLVNFKHNELSRWADYTRELTRHGDVGPLATQLSTAIVLAGVLGLPMMAEITSLYDDLTARMGEPKSLELEVMKASKALSESLGSNAFYALSNGIFTTLGVDVSKRLGMPDVVPNSISEAAFGGGSKLGMSLVALIKAAGSPDEAHAKYAAYTAAPSSIQGLLDRMWFEQGDLAFPKDPDKMAIPNARRNDTDKLFRSIGFAGINETVQKTAAYQNLRIDQVRENYKHDALVTMSQKVIRGENVSDTTLDKYLVQGLGDPKQLVTELDKLAIRQQLTADEYLMLQTMVSKRQGQLEKLSRRLQ